MVNRKAATYGVRLRFRHFRDACVNYIEIYGETPVETLLTAVKKENGRPYTMKPHNTNSLNQILGRDKRFELVDYNNKGGRSRPKSQGGFVWGVRQEL